MNQNNEPPKIVFEGEEFQRPRSFQTPTPKIVEWVIKYSGGAIRDQKQAEYVLLGFVIVAIGISLFLVFKQIRPQIKIEPPANIQLTNG